MSIQNTPTLEPGAPVAPHAGKVPKALSVASAALDELATTSGADELSGHFANDGARNFAATLATLDACRLALDAIETAARESARDDAQWHSQNLLAWQSAGVLPETATA